MTPVGAPVRLEHDVLPERARLWGAGRPAYPDEPPSSAAIAAGVRDWREAGVDLVVSLIEDWEIPARAPGLYALIEGCAIGLRRFPISDFGAPRDAAAFAVLLGDLRAQLAAGAGVLVHCNAGLGRTALVLASLLRYCGFPGDPVEEIRRIYRPTAMREPVQEAFVRHLAVGPNGLGRAL